MIYLLIASFLLCAVIARYKPPLAIALVILLWPAYLIRGEIAQIPTTVLEMAIYGTVIGATVYLLRFKKQSPPIGKTVWLLAGIWVVAWLVSSYFAVDKEAAFGAVKAWCLDPLLFGALLWIFGRSAAAKKLFIRSALLSASIVALAGIYQILFARDTLEDNRLSSFFHPVANYAAMYMAPIFIFGLSLVVSRYLLRIWLGPLALIAAALLATLSYGGFLSVGIGAFIVWLFLPAGRIKKVIGISAAISVIIFVSLLSTTENFRKHFSEGRSSGLVRTQIWTTSWALIRQNPITGVGPNNFETAYRQEAPKLYHPPLEWLVAKSHNLYLTLWLETGALGTIVFIAFAALWFKWVSTFFRSSPVKPIAIAAFAAVIGVLVHGLVDTPYFKNDLSLIFIFLLVIPWLYIAPEEK